MRPSRRRLIFISLLVLGAGLRIFNLGYRSLSTDEANVFWMARGTPTQIIRQNAIGNSAPPLYALALNPFAEAFASEAVLRSLSCAAGIAALVGLYALAAAYGGPTAGLFALFLGAISPAQVFYSQFLREYSLAVLCAALLLLAFTRFQRHARWSTWAALTAMIVLSIFIQYGLALLILALNIVFLIELRATTPRAARVAWWILAQGAALAAVWVVYDQTLRHQLRPGGFGASYLARGYWDGSGLSLLRLVIGNTFELFAFAHPAAPALQVLLLLGLIELWRTRDGRRAVLLLVIPLAVAVVCACLRLYPYIGARQMIVFTVMMYAVAASGFIQLRRLDWRSVGSAIAIIWIAAEGLYGSYRTLLSTEPQHVRPIAALLAAEQQPGDRIYVYHRAVTPLRYYVEDGANLIPGVASPHDLAFHERQIAALLAEPGRVWMVFSLCDWGECNAIRRAAASRRTVARVATATGTELYLVEAAAFPP